MLTLTQLEGHSRLFQASVLMGEKSPGKIRMLQGFFEHHSGKKKSNCAIVIPFGGPSWLLGRHLKHLQNQSTKDFDVLLIGKKPGKLGKKLNVLCFTERFSLGSSGGFGLGQALAYFMGYDYIITSDIDCLPVSRNLVQKLKELAAKEKKAVFPISVFDRNYKEGETRKNHIPNHYSIYPCKIFEKMGFAYFRFFKGGEDVAWVKRLKMENLLFCTDSVLVEHKNLESNYIEAMKVRGNKYIYYSKNFIIASIFLSSYSFEKKRWLSGISYAARAMLSLFEYRLLYYSYPDILGPATSGGLSLDVKTPYKKRATKLIELKGKLKCTQVLVETERGKGLKFRKKAWLIKKAKPLVALYLLFMLFRAIAKRADCLCPSKRFLDDYKFFIQYLILAKPIKYTDGKVYSSGMGCWRIATSIAGSVLLCPIFLARIIVAVLKAKKAKYPITVNNIGYHAKMYLNYLKKAERG